MPKVVQGTKNDVTANTRRRVEVFRPGTFTAMNGQKIEFTADDLRNIAAAYDKDNHPAPVVVGHPKTDDPAYAWIDDLDYDDDAGRMFADLSEDIDPKFDEAVSQGRYKKVSMSFHAPDSAANPFAGTYYPKHLGFLGAAAPAVHGLKPVQFSDEGEEVAFVFPDADPAEFGEPAMRGVATLFRNFREFLIEKHNRETADQVVPNWEIRWIDRAADRDDKDTSFSTKEDKMTGNADFAAREVELNEREEQIKADEAAAAKMKQDAVHEANVAFADGLVAAARVPTGKKSQLVAILDAMPQDGEEVSFSEGEEEVKKTPVQLLKDFLTDLPAMLEFGAHDLGRSPDDSGAVASFAVADGDEVDADQLEVHNKALAYQKQNPGTDYLGAIEAVS